MVIYLTQAVSRRLLFSILLCVQMKKIARRQQQQQQQQEQEQISGSRRGPSRGGRLSNDDSEGETSRYCTLRF